jgi:GPI-anchor transamidase subunit GAA1
MIYVNECDHRILESTLRTTNNLLERLHASFFFYILVGPERFLKIGSYLPSAVLISVAMMFGGLKHWVDAGWVRDTGEQGVRKSNPVTEQAWLARRRPVLEVLCIMVATHAMGAVSFLALTRSCFSERQIVCIAIDFFHHLAYICSRSFFRLYFASSS